ncbi:hypothetical protein ACLB2K_045708 [Fragaria x ananassa]
MANPKVRGEAWKKPEDVALCMAVVAIGEDGDKATNQEKKKLWDRIWEVYETCKLSSGVNHPIQLLLLGFSECAKKLPA